MNETNCSCKICVEGYEVHVKWLEVKHIKYFKAKSKNVNDTTKTESSLGKHLLRQGVKASCSHAQNKT